MSQLTDWLVKGLVYLLLVLNLSLVLILGLFETQFLVISGVFSNWRSGEDHRQAKELNRDCPRLNHKELLMLHISWGRHLTFILVTVLSEGISMWWESISIPCIMAVVMRNPLAIFCVIVNFIGSWVWAPWSLPLWGLRSTEYSCQLSSAVFYRHWRSFLRAFRVVFSWVWIK